MSIKELNSLMKDIGLKEEIHLVDTSGIETEAAKFFDLKLYGSFDDEVRLHLLNSFNAYLRNKFQPVEEQASRILKPKWEEINSFQVSAVDKKYQKEAFEAVDLHMLGYDLAALLVVARIFEHLSQEYLLLLSSKGNIDLAKQDIMSMKFENMLGYLRSKKHITEKDWLILSKLREDRNTGAHPSDEEAQVELVREAESTIKLALGLINKFVEMTEGTSL